MSSSHDPVIRMFLLSLHCFENPTVLRQTLPPSDQNVNCLFIILKDPPTKSYYLKYTVIECAIRAIFPQRKQTQRAAGFCSVSFGSDPLFPFPALSDFPSCELSFGFVINFEQSWHFDRSACGISLFRFVNLTQS